MPPYLTGKQLELQPQDLVVYQLIPSKLRQGLSKVLDSKVVFLHAVVEHSSLEVGHCRVFVSVDAFGEGLQEEESIHGHSAGHRGSVRVLPRRGVS